MSARLRRGYPALVVTTFLSLLPSIGGAAEDKELQDRGRAIVTKNCGRCHATGREGASAHPEALAFRMIGRRYPVESLEEALGEGIIQVTPTCPNSFSAAKM